MALAPRVTALATSLLAEHSPMRGSYITSLQAGSMSLETFQRSQQQFFYAVQFYAQPIAALVSRISDPRKRLDLVHNLVEEHGEFDEQKFHPTTFGRFLKSIGSQRPDESFVAMGPVLHAFNATLLGVCQNSPIESGIACLGIIELAFAEVSAAIGRVVVERGWVEADALVHYALHAELDIEHAQEFFELVEPTFDDPQSREATRAGLAVGAYAFDRLYRDLVG